MDKKYPEIEPVKYLQVSLFLNKGCLGKKWEGRAEGMRLKRHNRPRFISFE